MQLFGSLSIAFMVHDQVCFAQGVCAYGGIRHT